jgi:apolipoprotein N-acyltransferase
MKNRLTTLLALMLMLVLSLVACSSNKTQLHFSNKTECGTATIVLINTETGNQKEYTVDQDKNITIEIEPNTPYRYEVTYPRQPDFVVCDSKSVTTQAARGKTINITLASVLAPELQQATLEATTTPTN